MTERPPRAAEWLVERSLAADERDAVLGDLAEEHAEIAETAGAPAARAWYWHQALVSIPPNLHRRATRPRGVPVDTDPIDAGGRRRGTLMDSVILDIRYAWRMVRRRPIVTSVALASLIIGIALPAVVFCLLDSVLLRPLAIEAPDRLGVLLEVREDGINHNFSYPDFAEYRAAQRTLIDMAAYSRADITLQRPGGSQIVASELVSGSYFQTLGVAIRFGRGLTDADDRADAAPVAVVSDSLWRELTSEGDATFTARSVTLNARDFAIVGVARSPFRGMEVGRDARIWAPLHAQPVLDPSGGQNFLPRRSTSWLTVVGRLRPDATRERAAADLNAVEATLAPAAGRSPSRRLTLVPGRQGDSSLPEMTGAPLTLLLGAAILVLLVACANVANLLLARATERSREIAVRVALGAGRARVARLVLIETVMLGFVGSLAALVVARWIAELAVPFISRYGAPVTLDLTLDWRVAGFVAAAGVGATVMAALAPVLGAVRTASFGEGGRTVSPGPASTHARRGLIIVQFALSLALVVAASLLAQTVYNLRTITTGFDMDHVALVAVDPEAAQLDAGRTRAYLNAAIERLARVPGVKAAGFGRVIPLGFGGSRTTIVVPGYQPAKDEDMEINFNVVSPSYFEAMGMSLVGGRAFDDRDVAGRPAVAIVNQTMAARYWPRGTAVGQHIRFGRNEPPIEIVGVAHDVKYRTLREESAPSFYLPLGQERARAGVLHVRTEGDPRVLLDTLRKSVLDVDAAVPITAVRTLRDQVRLNLNDERLAMMIGLTLGAAAMLLAAVGLYGSMSYAVGQRMRELGVRMALGATARDIRRLVLGQGLVLSFAGTVLGAGLAVVLARSLENRLFGVRAADLPTLIASACVLIVVAIVATWLPARRAARVDPVEALRVE
jgi:predicted permease